jgi:hypothetical protein
MILTMKNKRGQSTIEFLVVFLLVIAVLFLHVKLVFNTAVGNLGHYGTFMTSRIFLVYDNNSNDPANSDGAARDLASGYFNEKFMGKITALGAVEPILSFNLPKEVEGGKKVEYVGAILKFQQTLSIFPLIAAGLKAVFVSESFLGREPSRSDCVKGICRAMDDGNEDCSFENDSSLKMATLFDNGC